MKLKTLVATSREVASTPRRLEKIAKLATLFGALSGDDVAIAVGFLTGWPRQGKIGAGWASAVQAREVPAASEATLDLGDVSVRFEGDQCESAEGEVRAGFSGTPGGLALPAAMRGALRCQAGAVLLPLAGQSGMEQLNISIAASGRWRAELVVRAGDPATVQRLTAAGFAPGAGGYVRRIDGSF